MFLRLNCKKVAWPKPLAEAHREKKGFDEKSGGLFLLVLLFVTTNTLLLSQNQDTDSIAYAIDIEDVVVTAQYAPTDSKNAVHSIRSIDRRTIDRLGATNLEQLLQQDANIRISQDLILGSSLSLLGVSGQNIKIMIDGVPVIGRLNGNIDLSQINLQNIERIEIVEGPLSVSYGTDALGGVINLISKRSQLNNYEIGLNAQIEDRGETNLNAQFGFRPFEKLLIQFNGGRDKFDGFTNNDSLRSVPWNPKEQWYLDALARYQFGTDHQISYRLSYFDEEVINLGDIRRPQFKPYAFDDFYKTERFNHSLLHEGTVGSNYYWNNTLAYNQYLRKKNSFRQELESDENELIVGAQDTTEFNTFTFRSVIASKYPNKLLNFQLGLDFRYDNTFGKRIRDEESEELGRSFIGDYALFGSVRLQPTENLILEAGLRAAHNTRYDAPIIPSLHVKYDIDQHISLRASYAKGFRSPDLKELFFNFIDINHFIIGNPDLKAEHSNNLQFSLAFDQEINQQRWQLKANVFYNNIQDRIGLFEFLEEEDGTIVPVTTDTSTFRFAYFNQAIYKTQGLNVNSKYQTKQFQLSLGSSIIGYYNPASEDFSQVDRFTYAWEINASAQYNLAKYQTSFSIFWRKNDQRITFFPVLEDGKEIIRQRTIDGYSLIDFTLAKSFWNKRIAFTLGVKNLLNIQQADITGGGPGGAHSGDAGSLAIGTGRNYFARMLLKFGW